MPDWCLHYIRRFCCLRCLLTILSLQHFQKPFASDSRWYLGKSFNHRSSVSGLVGCDAAYGNVREQKGDATCVLHASFSQVGLHELGDVWLLLPSFYILS
jgi:hypothetical protein